MQKNNNKPPEISNTIITSDGSPLNTDYVRECLFMYWQFTAAEKRSFDRTKDREDLKEKARAGGVLNRKL